MNTIWSDYVQNIGTLYFSRTLRFSDEYQEKYRNAFRIDGKKRILEIGCGPGALTQSLTRWYPHAEVVGIDRDTAFIEFAKQQAPDIEFLEADAAALPFKDNSFDVVISHTVQEHIEPSAFFGEQFRVLKPNGVCLVLSARRGINIIADCIAEQSSFEEAIWKKVEPFYQNVNQEYHVGRYSMSESELPSAMEQYGFCQISTDYLTINLTPDNPEYSQELACAMINANRQTNIDAVTSLMHIAPGVVDNAELSELKKLVNAKYDKRIAFYHEGIKQWDTNVALTMVLRGVK